MGQTDRETPRSPVPGQTGLDPVDALRSAANVARHLASGRLDHRDGRLGTAISTTDGQRFVVYRETALSSTDSGSASGSTVLAFRFHLRLMPRPIRPLAVRIFEPLSVLTTPFFAGLPGFRTKLWLFDHDTGDYMGVYEWANAADAERYARALGRLMTVLTVPGSVSYEVVADQGLDGYVEARRVA